MQNPQFADAITAQGAPINKEEPKSCIDKIDPWDLLLFAVGFIIIAASMGFLGLYFYELGVNRTFRERALNTSTCPDDISCINTAARVLSYNDLTKDPCTSFYDYACDGFKDFYYLPSLFTGITSVPSLLNDKRLNDISRIVKNDRFNNLQGILTDPIMNSLFQNITTYYQSCISTVSSSIETYVSKNRTQSEETANKAQDAVKSYINSNIVALKSSSDSNLLRRLHRSTQAIAPNAIAVMRGLDPDGTGLFPTGFFDLVIYPTYSPDIQPVLALVPPFLSLSTYMNLSSSEDIDSNKEEISDTIAFYLVSDGSPEKIDSIFENIVDIEKELSKQWQLRPAFLPENYQTQTIDEIATMYPDIMATTTSPVVEWKNFLVDMGMPKSVVDDTRNKLRIYVSSPEYFANLNNLLQTKDIGAVVDYASWMSLVQLGAIAQLQGFPIYGINFPNIAAGFNPYSDKTGKNFRVFPHHPGWQKKSGFVNNKKNMPAFSFGQIEFTKELNAVPESFIKSGILSPNQLLALEQLIADYNREGFVAFEKSAAILDVISNNVCVKDVIEKKNLAISRFFAALMLPETNRQFLKSMADEVVNAFKNRVNNKKLEPYLDDSTRKAASEKLDMMAKFIGFPDEILQSDYLKKFYGEVGNVDSVVISDQNDLDSDRFFLNAIILIKNINAVPFKFWTQNLATTSMTIYQDWTEVNAFYLPEFNSLIVPLGFLQPGIVSRASPVSMIYGSVGVIMGHEVSHAFDKTGILYDKYGNFKSVLTTDDAKGGYLADTDCFISYYSQFQYDGFLVAGNRTLNENLADHGALKSAWDAFNNVRQKVGWVRLPGLLNYTEEQLFWVAYAQSFCSVLDPDLEYLEHTTGAHVIPSLRVDVSLSLNENFAKSWQCSKDKPMAMDVNKCSLFKRSRVEKN